MVNLTRPAVVAATRALAGITSAQEPEALPEWVVVTQSGAFKILNDAIVRLDAANPSFKVQRPPLPNDADETQLKVAVGVNAPPCVFINRGGGLPGEHVDAKPVPDLPPLQTKSMVTRDRSLPISPPAPAGGSTIRLGSISWHRGRPDLELHEPAKAGIEDMARSLARDLGSHKIRVNCGVPGGVRTPRQTRLWHDGPQQEARRLEQQCLKERVEPKHVAAMVLSLAADDRRMRAGHNDFADAGWL